MSGLALVAGLTMLGSGPAEAATYNTKFNESASKVAKKISCKNPRQKSGGGSHSKSSLVCDLKGKRVNVITFKNMNKQLAWIEEFPWAVDMGTRGHFGYNEGVIVVAKDLNKSSAKAGAKAIRGWVYTADSAYDDLG